MARALHYTVPVGRSRLKAVVSGQTLVEGGRVSWGKSILHGKKMLSGDFLFIVRQGIWSDQVVWAEPCIDGESYAGAESIVEGD